MIEYAMRDALLDDATVAGLVADRIYPVDGVEQGTRDPHMTYQRISTVPDGRLLDDGSQFLLEPRIQWNVVALSATAVRNLVLAAAAVFSSPALQLEGALDVVVEDWSEVGKDQDTKLYAAHFDVKVTLAAAEAA